MSHFFIRKDSWDAPGTSHIEVCFVVYRHKFGHHPTFLPQDEEKGRRDGFNTQFYYIAEENIPDEKAEEKLEYYKNRYDSELEEIEEDDTKWEQFPFKGNELVWYK